MSIFLTVLHVVVCLSLIAIILLQAGRGQGLTGPSFGSGNVQSLFGTRAADFLSKATTVAAICFLLTAIGLDILEVNKSRSLLNFSNKQSTLDMDAIKKALETVKAEGTTADPAAVAPVEEVKTTADKASVTAETTATEAASELTPSAEPEKPAAT